MSRVAGENISPFQISGKSGGPVRGYRRRGYEVGFRRADWNVRGRVSSAIESKGRLRGPPEVSRWGVEGLSDENLFAFGASHNGLLKSVVRRNRRLLAHRKKH